MYAVPGVIESNRLRLRRFQASDLAFITRFMTTPEVTRYLSFPDEMKTEDGAKQLLEATLQAYDSSKPLFALVVEEKASGALVGCCGVNPLDGQTAEIFYAVMPEYWGRGIATEMARALVKHLLEEHGARKLVGFIVPANNVSKRVVEKLGFRDAGLVQNPNFKERVHEFVLVHA